MVGVRRLDNVQQCVTEVLQRGVPGDLVETGVWRGGVAILMRAVLKAFGGRDRSVWAADSFRDYRSRTQHAIPLMKAIATGRSRSSPHRLRMCERTSRAMGSSMTASSSFLAGSETHCRRHRSSRSALRLDGDMYESTWVALESLYPKLSAGGFAIIDDYNCVPQCKLPVDEFRARHGITDHLTPIDWTGVFSQRGA